MRRASGETVGILQSDNYASLNGGYYVVFTGDYSTKTDAEDALGDVAVGLPRRLRAPDQAVSDHHGASRAVRAARQRMHVDRA